MKCLLLLIVLTLFPFIISAEEPSSLSVINNSNPTIAFEQLVDAAYKSMQSERIVHHPIVNTYARKRYIPSKLNYTFKNTTIPRALLTFTFQILETNNYNTKSEALNAKIDTQIKQWFEANINYIFKDGVWVLENATIILTESIDGFQKTFSPEECSSEDILNSSYNCGILIDWNTEALNREKAINAARNQVNRERAASVERILKSGQPDEVYLSAVISESESDYNSAKTLYSHIISNFAKSPVALKAADRLLAINEKLERQKRDSEAIGILLQQQLQQGFQHRENMSQQNELNKRSCEAQRQSCYAGCNKNDSNCSSRCGSISCY